MEEVDEIEEVEHMRHLRNNLWKPGGLICFIRHLFYALLKSSARVIVILFVCRYFLFIPK